MGTSVTGLCSSGIAASDVVASAAAPLLTVDVGDPSTLGTVEVPTSW